MAPAEYRIGIGVTAGIVDELAVLFILVALRQKKLHQQQI